MPKTHWWYLGIGTEVFHVLFAFGVLLGGRLWLPGILVDLMLALTIMSQILFLGCPISMLSNYFFCKNNPDRKAHASLTLYLYSRYGVWIGIPILILLVSISLFVGTMLMPKF